MMFRLTILTLILIVFAACKTAVVPPPIGLKSKQIAENKCDKIIRYYSDKLKIENGGQEVDAKTEIVINPFTKLISLTSEPPNQEKVNFDTVIESIDCNLNSEMSEGYSVYRGFIKRIDGTTSKAVIKVVAENGNLTISNADPEKENGLLIVITKWEIVSE